jgi:hypothetical protein
MGGKVLTPAACASDGSDKIVMGTYSYDWNTSSKAFSVDVMMPDCTFCQDPYHIDIPTAPTELRRLPETWVSSWDPNRTRISVVLSDGSPFGTVSPDGHTLTANSSKTVLSRDDGANPEFKRCDGWSVVSASNYY